MILCVCCDSFKLLFFHILYSNLSFSSLHSSQPPPLSPRSILPLFPLNKNNKEKKRLPRAIHWPRPNKIQLDWAQTLIPWHYTWQPTRRKRVPSSGKTVRDMHSPIEKQNISTFRRAGETSIWMLWDKNGEKQRWVMETWPY